MWVSLASLPTHSVPLLEIRGMLPQRLFQLSTQFQITWSVIFLPLNSLSLEFNSTVSSHQRRLKTSKLLAVVLVLQNVSYCLHQGLVSVSIATQFDIA